MRLSPKQKLGIITALAMALFLISAILLRGGRVQGQPAVWGWGGIMIFSCITFVRGIFAIRRFK